MSSHAVPAAAAAERLHADGVAAFEAGDLTAAADLLAQAANETFEPAVLNDLAVVLAALGETDRARALLTTCLTLDETDADALANLEQLDDTRSWRSSPTIAGDEQVPERAYPGMPLALTMSEHAMRYSMALGVLPGSDFLDVGCGTGYGSEMLTWRGGRVRGFDLWQPAEHERPRWSGGAELTYGFDVTKQELPAADAAVMFEVLEHLHDAPGGPAQRLRRRRHAARVVPEPGPPRLAPQPAPRQRLAAGAGRGGADAGRRHAVRPAQARPHVPAAGPAHDHQRS